MPSASGSRQPLGDGVLDRRADLGADTRHELAGPLFRPTARSPESSADASSSYPPDGPCGGQSAIRPAHPSRASHLRPIVNDEITPPNMAACSLRVLCYRNAPAVSTVS